MWRPNLARNSFNNVFVAFPEGEGKTKMSRMGAHFLTRSCSLHTEVLSLHLARQQFWVGLEQGICCLCPWLGGYSGYFG